MAKTKAKKAKIGQPDLVSCTVKNLPEEHHAEAARVACRHNPANAPPPEMVAMMLVGKSSLTAQVAVTPERLAFYTSRYWGAFGVNLGVSFLDNPTPGFRQMWLDHANAWGEFSNVRFRWSGSGGEVQVTRVPEDGYWSYLGTDILLVPRGKASMNLAGFTEHTPPAELRRVVGHEVGHTLGCPHEHLRRDLIARLDEAKVLVEYRLRQGWSVATIRANLLTPIEDRSVMGSSLTDEDSIMCYPIPGRLTNDGRDIRGGTDFSTTDRIWAARVYPRAVAPPPPAAKRTIVVSGGPVTISFEGGSFTIDGQTQGTANV